MLCCEGIRQSRVAERTDHSRQPARITEDCVERARGIIETWPVIYRSLNVLRLTKSKARRKSGNGFFRRLNATVEPRVRSGFASPGLLPAGLIVLETTGQRSGETYRTPLLATLEPRRLPLDQHRTGQASQLVKKRTCQSRRELLAERPGPRRPRARLSAGLYDA